LLRSAGNRFSTDRNHKEIDCRVRTISVLEGGIRVTKEQKSVGMGFV
jgi:hypothetical protein